ncbi:MAG: RNA pseudouridine synthase [Clostridiales bacterium]|nr:RNA pseudouridine synthase [Clostridiales bacterium]
MIEVLFEDNHTIVVVKPPGVPVMPDSTGDTSMMDLVKAFIKTKYDKPGKVFLGLVHRIDRSTGGVMVFAKTTKGASRLSKQIRERQIKKTYLAVVSGHMDRRRDVFKNYLIKDSRTNKSIAVPEGTVGAKEAILEYKLISSRDGFSLLEIQLITGRHHQIRVQLSSRGHILYGDVKYGSPNKAKLGLWAKEIEFQKPVGKDIVKVGCEPDYRTEPWRRFS